jgi:hypothetical protein
MNKQWMLIMLVALSVIMSALCLIDLRQNRLRTEALIEQMATIKPSQTPLTTSPSLQSSAQITDLQTQLTALKQQVQQLQLTSTSTAIQSDISKPVHAEDTLTLVNTLRSKNYLTKDELQRMTEQSKQMSKADNKLYLETLFAKLGQDSFEVYDSAQQ